MSLANTLNGQNASSVFPATSGFLQVAATSPVNVLSVTPGTVPHFDCSSKIEREIMDILIFHDILVGVRKPVSEKANVNASGKNFIFINLNAPKETTWTVSIGNILYKIKLAGNTLRFFRPDGVNYSYDKVGHNNIFKLLLALIHNEMDFCNKCTIPTQEVIVFQTNEPVQTVYDLGHNWIPSKQMTLKTVPNTTDLETTGTITTSGTTWKPTNFTTVTTTGTGEICDCTYNDESED